MKILVTGGAGYIGSHMVKMLLDHGRDVVVLDNLSNGHRDAVTGGEFIEGDVRDSAVLDTLFKAHRIDGVMHFAGFIEVAESMQDPAKYYNNNVGGSQHLLEAMVRHDVNHLIFSSTAAIYGELHSAPIHERHAQLPVNPYGRSKLMVEEMLSDFDQAYGLRSISLRYFNAAGADPAGQLGERHDPETHLIPLVLQAASGRRDSIHIFGNDYDTPDGTCVRDYIHIVDLCQAHLLALGALAGGAASSAYNLGNGSGFSVKEVIDTVKKVTGHAFKVIESERRPGDPAVLVADSFVAKEKLGWAPEFSDLDTIITHAWAWEQKMGYN